MVKIHPRLIHRTTRKQRRDARQGVVLAEAGISERTRKGYLAALQKLLMPVIEGVSSPSQLDVAVAGSLEQAWEDGETLYVVSNALCGLHFYEPMTRHCIPSAWRLFATWRKLEWQSRAPPLTCSIVKSLANYALSHGDLFFAALLCLGFFGLLRTGEMLALRGSDILCSSKQLILSLKGTKSGQRNSADETVAVDDQFSILILQTVLDILTTRNALSHRLWEFSNQSFKNHFESYMKRFHLTHLLFRPYSLRRGGQPTSSRSQEVWNLLWLRVVGQTKLRESTFQMASVSFLICYLILIPVVFLLHGILAEANGRGRRGRGARCA